MKHHLPTVDAQRVDVGETSVIGITDADFADGRYLDVDNVRLNKSSAPNIVLPANDP